MMLSIYNNAGKGVMFPIIILSDYYCLQQGQWVLPLGTTEPC